MKLALSGGGFRAAIFQLGVIRYLRETDQLKEVKEIYSVSGGSIIAAHLVKHWDDYAKGSLGDFNRRASELVGFMSKDIRTKVVCTWLMSLVLRYGVLLVLISQVIYWIGMSWITLLFLFLMFLIARYLNSKFPRIALVKLLQKEYDVIYGGVSVNDIGGNNPHLYLLTTDLTTGRPAYIDRHGISFDLTSQPPLRIPHNSLSLSFAVAASSAFPPLFSPVCVDRSVLNCDDNDLPFARHLSDGGIYDNLGLEAIRLNQNANDSNANSGVIISCNAECKFDNEVEQEYGFIISRSVRSSDIMMSYMSRARGTMHESLNQIRLQDDIVEPSGSHYLRPELQRAVRNLRTDLDDFSKLEIQVLYFKGYGTARSVLSLQRDEVNGITLSNLGVPLRAEDGKWLPFELQESEAENAVERIKSGFKSNYFKKNRYTIKLAAVAFAVVVFSLPIFSGLLAIWGEMGIVPWGISANTVIGANYDPPGHKWIISDISLVAKPPSCNEVYIAESGILGLRTFGMGHSKFNLALQCTEKSCSIGEVRAYLIDSNGFGKLLYSKPKNGRWIVAVPPGYRADRIVLLIGVCNNGPDAANANGEPFDFKIERAKE